MINNSQQRLKVCEIFKSIQGEGINAGELTTFIRLSGCNLKCVWCDTKYHEEGKDLEIEEILKIVKKLNIASICLTGGEPLIQKDIVLFIVRLLEENYCITIETNGTQYPVPIRFDLDPKKVTYSVDYKLPSSMQYLYWKENNFLSCYENKNNSIKFVIASEQDYEIAKKFAIEYKEKSGLCKILFSPCGNLVYELERQIMPKKLAEKIIEDNLPVRLSLQLHKILWHNERER